MAPARSLSPYLNAYKISKVASMVRFHFLIDNYCFGDRFWFWGWGNEKAYSIFPQIFVYPYIINIRENYFFSDFKS